MVESGLARVRRVLAAELGLCQRISHFIGDAAFFKRRAYLASEHLIPNDDTSSGV